MKRVLKKYYKPHTQEKKQDRLLESPQIPYPRKKQRRLLNSPPERATMYKGVKWEGPPSLSVSQIDVIAAIYKESGENANKASRLLPDSVPHSVDTVCRTWNALRLKPRGSNGREQIKFSTETINIVVATFEECSKNISETARRCDLTRNQVYKILRDSAD